MEHTREAEERAVTLVMLRSHVERCLQNIRGVRELVVDGDGDYPFRRGTAMGWVSAVDRLTLAGAVVAVGEVADGVGGLLAAVFGGQTPLPAIPQEHDQTTTEEAA